MEAIGVGLIGTGFMGKAHALAWNSVRPVFGDVPDVRLVHLGEAERRAGARARPPSSASRRRPATGASVIADPEVDVVSITTPNKFHLEMATAALAAGKHVWCEKPMAPKLADAEEMLAAARASGKVAVLGYNYIQNPVDPAHPEAARRGRDRPGQPCPHRDGRGFPGRSRSAVPAAPRGDQRLGRARRFRRASAVAALHAVRRRRAASCATWPSPIRPARRRRATREVEVFDIATILLRLENGASGLHRGQPHRLGPQGPHRHPDFRRQGLDPLRPGADERVPALSDRPTAPPSRGSAPCSPRRTTRPTTASSRPPATGSASTT